MFALFGSLHLEEAAYIPNKNDSLDKKQALNRGGNPSGLIQDGILDRLFTPCNEVTTPPNKSLFILIWHI